MITFKIAGNTAQGTLDGQTFTVPNEPTTEKLLNAIAKANPVKNGGSPDPDFDLFQNVATAWPFIEIVSNRTDSVRLKNRIY